MLLLEASIPKLDGFIRRGVAEAHIMLWYLVGHLF